MNIAIVGAGATARGMAALAESFGHHVGLWSPSGRHAWEPLPPDSACVWPHAAQASFESSGALERPVKVARLDAADAVAAADLVVIALPAPAYANVLEKVAPHLQGQVVIFSGALSLAPLWLFELAQQHGASPAVGVLGTTIVTARSDGANVRLMTMRTRVDVAAIPATQGEHVLAACRAAFGDRFDLQASALSTALANINPIAHGALALANLTRIERAETWPQYHYMTPAVAHLIEAMDRERLALAQAFGVQVRPIEQHFQRSFDVPQASLAAIAEELHRRRGGPPGPTSLDTRFIEEDVPFGLVFYEALGRQAGVATPVMSALVTALAAALQRDFRAENPLLEKLDIERITVNNLRARLHASTPP